MPGRRTHQLLGASSGVFCVLDLLERVPSHGQLSLIAGGMIGGVSGAVLPDVLEPAEHPHHRNMCHSVAALGTVVWYWRAKAPVHVELLLAKAAGLREQLRCLPASDPGRTSLALREQACYFAVGALRGALAGYVSHVVADAATPRGIPLVLRSVV